jgi:hypothetical protein
MLAGRINVELRFENMLSEDMNYSSAIFLDYTEDLVKAPELCEPLESAQERKMKWGQCRIVESMPLIIFFL